MIDLSSIPPSSDPQIVKYTDAAKWIAVCERRAQAVGLGQPPSRRVLDIGTGCGYFPFVCRARGHAVTALDRVDRDRFYRDVTAALGVDVVEHDVMPFRALPIIGTFDAITAYMVTFNGHRSASVWGPLEWSFFLDDIESRLTPDGVIVLELNREPNGHCYTPTLEQLFRVRGAEIDRHRIVFRR